MELDCSFGTGNLIANALNVVMLNKRKSQQSSLYGVYLIFSSFSVLHVNAGFWF